MRILKVKAFISYNPNTTDTQTHRRDLRHYHAAFAGDNYFECQGSFAVSNSHHLEFSTSIYCHQVPLTTPLATLQ